MNKLFRIIENEKSLQKIIKEKKISDKLLSKMDSIFGKLAKDIKTVFYRKGLMYIEVKNYMWVNELDFYKKNIINKANEVLGKKKTITKIKIKLQEKDTSDFNDDKYININNKAGNMDNKSLEEKIVFNNLIKKNEGCVLCSECGKVFVSKEFCVFCRQQNL